MQAQFLAQLSPCEKPGPCKLLLSYLTGRVQSVRVGGAYSDPMPVGSGVPQGSIVGPLLFNAYINYTSSDPSIEPDLDRA